MGWDIVSRKVIFYKKFASGIAGIVWGRQQTGNVTDVVVDHAVGLGWKVVSSIVESVFHDLVPDRGGTGNAGGDVTHRGVVIITNPGGDQDVRGKANGPVIAEVVSSAGFNADGLIGNDELATGAKGADAGIIVQENVTDNVSDLFRQGNPDGLSTGFGGKWMGSVPESGPILMESTDIIGSFGGMILLEDFAVIGLNLEDGTQGDGDAGVGEGTEGDGHVGHHDFAATKGEGEAISSRVGKGSDTHGTSGGDKRLETIEGEHFNGGDV